MNTASPKAKVEIAAQGIADRIERLRQDAKYDGYTTESGEELRSLAAALDTRVRLARSAREAYFETIRHSLSEAEGIEIANWFKLENHAERVAQQMRRTADALESMRSQFEA